MSAVLLVPLLPLLTTLIVMVGGDSSRPARAKIAAWPIAAAFCGAIATLYAVVTQGPIVSGFTIPRLPFLFRYPSASTSIGSAPS